MLFVKIAIIYLCWGLFIWTVQRKLIYPRHLMPSFEVNLKPFPLLEKIWIDTPAGKVESWFLPGKGRTSEKPGPAVLFAHGNGEVIDHWPKELQPYRDMGISVFLPEYRGYGRSQGNPGQKVIKADMLAFLAALKARPEVNPEQIIYHGRSLGGGVVCDLANDHPPYALIVQSTFSSLSSLAVKYALPSFVARDPYENNKVMAKLTCPMLIFHGKHDEIIAFSHAEKLKGVAPQATLIGYESKHNDFPPDKEVFFKDIRRFLVEAGLSLSSISSD